MRVLTTVCLSLVFAAGAVAATAGDIVGTWVVDPDATWASWQSRPEMARVPENLRATVKAQALQQMARLSWRITGDTMTRIDGDRSDVATYQVTAVDGDVLTVTSADATGTKRAATFAVTDDTLVITGLDTDTKTPSTQGALILRRKQ